MDFVLLDQTNGAKTGDGSTLTHADLVDIATAVEVQLNRDASPEWGGSHRVRAGTASNDILPLEHVHAIMPALVGVPNAIAFHDVSGDGVPYSLDGITLNDTLVGPGNSLSISTSHELLEIIGNRGCNRWAADNRGTQYANELCDAVEQQSYSITLVNGREVYVSNFVLQDFFVPGSPGPFDFLSTLGANDHPPPAPFETAPGRGGNYQIVETAGVGERQVTAIQPASTAPHVFARGTVAKPDKRRHWSSRTYRLGVRV